METNRYSPTPWVRPSNYIGASWPDHLVFLGRNRDSDLLTNHNFETAYERVLAASSFEADDDRSPSIVSESHWACGWIEWIAIHKDDAQALALANEIADHLDTYPILDEDRYSDREFQEIYDLWHNMSVRDRYELIVRKGDCSIFAARRGELPDDQGIEETLRGWL